MLHIIKSYSSIKEIIQYASSTDTLLLVEDAVYAANSQHPVFNCLINSELSISALLPDIQARGLVTCIDSQIILVNFDGWVALTEKDDKSITWE
jgi:tRNA 2-thiouridine synthesizing protein B